MIVIEHTNRVIHIASPSQNLKTLENLLRTTPGSQNLSLVDSFGRAQHLCDAHDVAFCDSHHHLIHRLYGRPTSSGTLLILVRWSSLGKNDAVRLLKSRAAPPASAADQNGGPRRLVLLVRAYVLFIYIYA